MANENNLTPEEFPENVADIPSVPSVEDMQPTQEKAPYELALEAAQRAEEEQAAAPEAETVSEEQPELTQAQIDAELLEAQSGLETFTTPTLSKKEMKKKAKELKSMYHVSNFDIIKNCRSYNASEKTHYRYIFMKRISAMVWPIFRMIILIGLAFVILYPIIYMLSTAFRPQDEMSDPSVMWIPKTFIFSNIQETWDAMKYPEVLKNTLVINVVCSLLQVVTCSITGYGFARFKFKGRGLMFGIVILQIIVPVQIILIPLFMQFRYFDIFGIITAMTGAPLNLIDTPIALYAQAFFCNGIRAGLFIFLFRQFFRGLPKELEDAAYLDGCGPLSTFIRIMVPNARSSYLTVFIFSLVWYWNDYYVSSMFFTESKTISLEIANIYYTVGYYLTGGDTMGPATDYMVWMEAACLLAILPILILYIFLQRYFIEGIERSGIVG